MDYIDFINSKDIRAYLKSIDYKPNLLESAYFIYASSHKTMDERHMAWEELIRETDDIILDEKAGGRWQKTVRRIPAAYGMSAHELIKMQMKNEKLILSYFNSDDDDCVFVPEFTFYSKRYVGDYRRVYQRCEAGLYFGCNRDAQKYCLKEIKEDSDIIGYSITKHLFSKASDDHSNYLKVRFNLSGDAMSEYHCAQDHERFPAEMSTYLDQDAKFSAECDFFDQMWFDIPIPFKKGDIVIPCASSQVDHTPFVMLGTDPEWRRKDAEEGKRYREGTDSSDMIAMGWSIGFGDSLKEIYDDAMANYLDIEYYREEFKGLERLLPLLSAQIKGDIDLYDWEILKDEILRSSQQDHRIEYMRSFPEISRILDGSAM